VFRATELARQVHVTEAEAREQAERLRLALTGARLALWDWDLQAGTVYLSDRWQEMLGGHSAAIVITFRALSTLVHRMIFPELRRRLREVLKGRSPEYEVEHRVRTMSGNWIWIYSRGEVVARDPSGTALRMSGVNETSASASSQRSAFARTRQEMAQQRSELAHLSRAAMLGEISGSLAHELNQPLAAILSNAQAAQRFLAQDPGDLREVRAILQDIVDDDKRAGEVIRRSARAAAQGRNRASPGRRQRSRARRAADHAQRPREPQCLGRHAARARACRRYGRPRPACSRSCSTSSSTGAMPSRRRARKTVS
jgi:PAS domain S-box-containing protein